MLKLLLLFLISVNSDSCYSKNEYIHDCMEKYNDDVVCAGLYREKSLIDCSYFCNEKVECVSYCKDIYDSLEITDINENEENCNTENQVYY